MSIISDYFKRQDGCHPFYVSWHNYVPTHKRAMAHFFLQHADVIGRATQQRGMRSLLRFRGNLLSNYFANRFKKNDAADQS